MATTKITNKDQDVALDVSESNGVFTVSGTIGGEPYKAIASSVKEEGKRYHFQLWPTARPLNPPLEAKPPVKKTEATEYGFDLEVGKDGVKGSLSPRDGNMPIDVSGPAIVVGKHEPKAAPAPAPKAEPNPPNRFTPFTQPKRE